MVKQIGFTLSRDRVTRRDGLAHAPISRTLSDRYERSFRARSGLAPASSDIRVKLLLVVPISVALASQRDYPMLGMTSFFCFWNGYSPG
jgi:hypothetical protein